MIAQFNLISKFSLIIKLNFYHHHLGEAVILLKTEFMAPLKVLPPPPPPPLKLKKILPNVQRKYSSGEEEYMCIFI